MNKFFIIFLLFSSSCFSQTLIWERETQLNQPTGASLLPTIIDNDGNIVTAFDPCYSPFTDAYLIKYDVDGNLLSSVKYNINKILCPVSIIQTETGYNIFCGFNKRSGKRSSLLPKMINVNKNGDTLNTLAPYNVHNSFDVDTACFIINNGNINTLTHYGNYYNASVKMGIRKDENTTILKDHLIISSYSQDGRINWRKGLDTLADDGSFYELKSFKVYKSSHLVLLAYIALNNDYNIQIFIIDTDGKIIKKLEPIINDKKFIPIDIEELQNGDYAVLGQYLTGKKSTAIFKLNVNGEILKSVDITEHTFSTSYNSLWQSPTGNLILIGSTNTNNVNGDIEKITSKILFYQVDKNLNFISELQYYEHTAADNSGFRNIIFLNDDSFIAVGYKDRYKFYIAKFSLKSNNVMDGEISHSNLEISPNPASDFITITLERCATPPRWGTSGEVNIYNTLGEKVMSVGAENFLPARIDISALPKGMYFVRIGGEMAKFVKM